MASSASESTPQKQPAPKTPAGRGAPAADALGLSAIIINYNGGVNLITCLASLADEAAIREIIVVDNASTDGSADECILRFPDVRLRVLTNDSNIGFGAAANQGASQAQGDLLVFLNPDVVPRVDCMVNLLATLLQRGGVVGPVVFNAGSPSGEWGSTVDRMGMPKGLRTAEPPLFIQGCCLATTRRCFDAVGGFDGRYFLFVEDVEYCWQALRRGFDVSVSPRAALDHIGGAVAQGGYSRGNRIETTRMRIVLRERNTWACILANAPLAKLPAILAASALRSTAFTALIATKRPRDVWCVPRGFCWNVVGLPATLSRRWRPGVSRESTIGAWGRLSRRWFLWEALRGRQRVLFVDSD